MSEVGSVTHVSGLDKMSAGGRGGIRTHGTLAGTPVFKTGALNHSATLPSLRHQSLSGRKIKNGMATGPKLDPTSPCFFQRTPISLLPNLGKTGRR